MGNRLFGVTGALFSTWFCPCFLTSRPSLSVGCAVLILLSSWSLSMPFNRFIESLSSSGFSLTSFVPVLGVVFVGEMSPDRAFPPLASSKLCFLPTLVVVTGDFKASLVLGCFCSLEVTTDPEASVTDVLSAVTGDLTSASDGDLLGILDFEPVGLEGPLVLWSFDVGNIETVLSLPGSLCGGMSLEVPTFVLSVEALVFVVTVLALLPAAEDGVFAPLAGVCRLSAAALTPCLEGVAWLVPWLLTLDPTACDFAPYISEAAEVPSKSEASESVFSLTMGSGVFVSECVISSGVGSGSRLASLSSTLLFWRLGSGFTSVVSEVFVVESLLSSSSAASLSSKLGSGLTYTLWAKTLCFEGRFTVLRVTRTSLDLRFSLSEPCFEPVPVSGSSGCGEVVWNSPVVGAKEVADSGKLELDGTVSEGVEGLLSVVH